MINCPIINKEIDICECVLIVDISERCVKETMLPAYIDKVTDWKDICKSCKNHDN